MTLDWLAVRAGDLPSEGPTAFSSEVGPRDLLAAYREGLYPFPAATTEEAVLNELRYAGEVADGRIVIDDTPRPYAVAWVSPDPRPVIELQVRRPGRTLRRLARQRADWRSTVDQCFSRVVEQCAAGRTVSWITSELRAALGCLHADGIAHSVELWRGDRLIGGTFGIQLGAVFSADSQFTGEPGAGKLAVVDLMTRFAEAGGELLDVQHGTTHTTNLGARPMPRHAYVQALTDRRDLPISIPSEPRPIEHVAKVVTT